MREDRSSQTKEAWLAGPLEQATALVLRFPFATLAIAVAMALASLALAGWKLGHKTSRQDLLDPRSNYNRLWLEYLQEFGDQEDAVIVVEASDAEQVILALEDLSETLARDPGLFQSVLHKVDLAALEAKGLYYLSPEQLQTIEQFLQQAVPIVQGDWAQLNLASLLASGQADVERLVHGLKAALSQEAYQSPWPAMLTNAAPPAETGTGYLLADEGRLGMVLLRLAEGEAGFARHSQAIDALRERLAQVQERCPQVQIGLTGLPVLENDEMRTSSIDMYWASALSLLGVAVLFVVGFGGVRHAVLANLVLLMGMAWALGYATLAVGHLNILSVSFTVTLIGIGIDYGIHYIARYLQLRREEVACREALLAASRSVGPAIVTGAITTAIAFFAAALTSFTGLAELGIIAGGGLLLCGIAQLFVLPAAVLVIDRTHLGARLPRPWPVDRWLHPLMNRPRATLCAALLFTALAGMGAGRLTFDHNLLHMQATRLESVELEQRLLEKTQRSAWHAVSIASSREELLDRKRQFAQLPSVERTEDVLSLIPEAAEQKQPVIARIRARLIDLPEETPAIGIDPPVFLDQTLAGISPALNSRCQEHVDEVRSLLRDVPLAQSLAALSDYQQSLAQDLLSRLQALRGAAHLQPPTLDDLPAALVQRFVGRNELHLLKIYGRGDLWATENLAAFVADVRSVDARATGHPLQAYEASREMKHSYELAACYALGAILIVLLLDFRNLRLALLAALPLTVAVVQMFGLLGLLRVPLNPANLIVLPLILGIGVDYGVHIVHEYTRCRGPYCISGSTAAAVLIDGLTTIIGFASLLIASHRGLASIGLVLTIGVACCLLTSLGMLPAWLSWRSRRRASGDSAAPPTAETSASVPSPHWRPAGNLQRRGNIAQGGHF